MQRNQIVIVSFAAIMVVIIYFNFASKQDILLQEQKSLTKKLIKLEREASKLRNENNRPYKSPTAAEILAMKKARVDKSTAIIDKNKKLKVEGTRIPMDQRPKLARIKTGKDIYLCEEMTKKGKPRVVVNIKTDGNILVWNNLRDKVNLKSKPSNIWTYDRYEGLKDFYVDYSDDRGHLHTLKAKIIDFESDNITPSHLKIAEIKKDLKKEYCKF
ncbi:MAG: hypothetical protein HN576_03205 [Bacteriovoracaceae bacterium]|nr:hypothetical protein [Bacteriovoracaceae bacterium]